tara:strand:- start:322 stop:543 length:222 start_codon:yes stop_codon:yes gene_type:complete
MTTIEQAYDEIAYHSKESAKMPYTFSTMTVDQQLFFRDLFNEIMYNKEEQEELLEDLNLIKSDLEAVIAKVEK